jgi:hypothetical protein
VVDEQVHTFLVIGGAAYCLLLILPIWKDLEEEVPVLLALRDDVLDVASSGIVHVLSIVEL